MAFPAWSEELEAEMRRAAQTSMRAVYELLLERAVPPVPSPVGDGPWDDRVRYEECSRRYDAAVPPSPWPYP